MIFKCKNCGGNVVYHPAKKEMYCPHCDSINSEELMLDNAMTQCANCGAPVQTGEYTSASKCAHCGSYLIFQERVEGKYQPNLILPFKISKEQAVEALNTEFRKRVFTPESFLSEKSLEGMNGMYVPFWMYDYQTVYDFEGEGTKVRTWRSGDTEYTETSYYQIVREMNAGFDKIPVDASLAMDDGEMDLMEPYTYAELEDFQVKYMSGFLGEIYNEEADALEERAKGKVQEAMEELMQQSLSGYSRILPRRKDKNLKREGTNYTLLPVWMYFYQYRGKTYRFYVNGQTGKVVGKTPVSKEKVIAYGLSAMAYISVIAALAISVLEVL